MDKCPTCDRQFERFEDYPIIYLAKFQKIEVPEFVGSSFSDLHPEKKSKRSGNQPIPKEVFKLFQGSGKKIISYSGRIYERLDEDELHSEGMTWYQSAQDITEIVKRAIALPEVQDSLSALESLVGKEVLTKTILALPAFSKKLRIEDCDDISLACYGCGEVENELRVAKISLDGAWNGGSISSAGISQDLAQIYYEGRIRK